MIGGLGFESKFVTSASSCVRIKGSLLSLHRERGAWPLKPYPFSLRSFDISQRKKKLRTSHHFFRISLNLICPAAFWNHYSSFCLPMGLHESLVKLFLLLPLLPCDRGPLSKQAGDFSAIAVPKNIKIATYQWNTGLLPSYSFTMGVT